LKDRETKILLKHASLVIVKSTLNFDNLEIDHLNEFYLQKIYKRIGILNSQRKGKLIIQTHQFKNVHNVNLFNIIFDSVFRIILKKYILILILYF